MRGGFLIEKFDEPVLCFRRKTDKFDSCPENTCARRIRSIRCFLHPNHLPHRTNGRAVRFKLNFESQKPGAKFLEFQPASVGTHQVARLIHGQPVAVERFDTQGRLVASMNLTGDTDADKAALGRNLRAGVYLDKWVGQNGVVVNQTRAAVP